MGTEAGSGIGMSPPIAAVTRKDDEGKELTFGGRVPSLEGVSKSKALGKATQPKDLNLLVELGDSNGLEKELAAKRVLLPTTWFTCIQTVLSQSQRTEDRTSREGVDYPRCLDLLLLFRYDEQEVLSGKSPHILLLKHTVDQELEELGKGPQDQVPSSQVALALLQRFPSLAFQPAHNNRRSVLHEIAKDGAIGVLDIITTVSDRKQLVKALGAAVERKTGPPGRTPLGFAIENEQIKVIERLLSYSPELANEAGILGQAVEKENLEIVQALFKNSPERLGLPLEEFDTAIEVAVKGGQLKIVEFLINGDAHRAKSAIGMAVSEGQLEIVKFMVKGNPQLLTTGVFDEIGKAGRVDVWDHTQAQNPDEAAVSDVLHIAVEKGHLPLAQAVVVTHPKLVVRRDAKGRSPLYYNKRDEQEDQQAKEQRESIRDLLVQKIMREEEPLTIRNLLSEENEGKPGDSKEICLDLTAFSEDSHDFTLLIETSIQPKFTLLKHLDVAFESTLRYVDFPDLEKLRQRRDKAGLPSSVRYTQQSSANGLKPAETPREEVKHVLGWLNAGRQVQKIIELKVPDSLHEPHTEDTIIQSIKDFKVEILDWKRLDLSIDCVSEAAEHVQKLHLYGSGNLATISHWTGVEGVCTLKNLEQVNIIILKDIIGDKCAGRYVKRAQKRLDDLKENCGYTWEHNVSCGQWDPDAPADPPANTQNQPKFKTAPPAVLTKLGLFQDFYKAYQQQLKDSSLRSPQTMPVDSPPTIQSVFSPIKIGLIDTGVNKSSFTQIRKGISYVYKKKKESPWWLAIDPHGTQMAGFICKLDPCCELYIAKAGETMPSYDNAVKSIRWAIKNHVDIISMSFALEGNPPDPQDAKDLHDAISEANGEGIVLLCSTADQGNNSSEVFPARNNETIGIAACNSYGKLAPFSSDLNANYFFQGVDVVTDIIPYMKSPQEILVSGSSVATAIAAGVASLILACHKLVYPDLNSLHRKEVVTDHFDRMKEDLESQNHKYVKPWEVFKVTSNMGDVAGRRWLWDTFSGQKWGRPAEIFRSNWERREKDGWR